MEVSLDLIGQMGDHGGVRLGGRALFEFAPGSRDLCLRFALLFAETRERVATWQVRATAELARELSHLARALCLFDPHAPVPTDRLAASARMEGEDVWQIHLAARLGMPTTMRLSEKRDWLWGPQDGPSAWYPTLTIQHGN